jgi:hypothetical protein
MKRFQDPNILRPIWTFVEFARPYLEEAGATTITPDQLEGAVWSAIIHEARGIAFFMHNNDPNCGEGSDCWSANEDRITAVNAKIMSLAPVINTQSYYNNTFERNGVTYYEYSFNNGTETMLKTYEDRIYIFAGIGLNQSPGEKAFMLPPEVIGTEVTVVGEDRTLPVIDGAFTDEFAAEHTHHVYSIEAVFTAINRASSSLKHDASIVFPGWFGLQPDIANRLRTSGSKLYNMDGSIVPNSGHGRNVAQMKNGIYILKSGKKSVRD